MFENSHKSDIDPNIGSSVRFCKECHNTLQPCVLNGHLAFSCTRKDCDFEMIVNGRGRQENTVNSFNTQSFQRINVDRDFCSDPTMPREKIDCKRCKYNEAIFMITQDTDDTKIELIYICCNPQCGHKWKKVVEE